MPQFFKHRFESPAKPGTWIYVQTDEEREAIRPVVRSIKKHWTAPNYFYHLMPGGHLRALNVHRPDAHFAVIDIHNFFGSITRNKVCSSLKKVGFPFVDALTIAHRSCVMSEGRRFLPFGYIQSPLIASVVLDKSELGAALRKVKKNGVRVSVFMDDIIVSHDSQALPVQQSVELLSEAASKSKFYLSQAKTQGPATLVQVFNILLENDNLVLNEARYESFAQAILENGNGQSTSGILGYVAQINQDQLADLEALAH